jgi:NAD(P)H-nitrite reductase large subunit
MSDTPADDCTVCFCNCVKRSELVAAIRAGATTHGLIMERTKASTGCGGCEPEVLEILESELAAARQVKKAG